MSSFQIWVINILLISYCAKSSAGPQSPILVSELPSDPLEPVDKWLWTRVGEEGYLYQYPLEFGPREQSVPSEPPIRDQNNLLSFEEWLKKEEKSGNVTKELSVLMLSITEAIKTITAITKFPVTRNIAMTKGIYETAAPTAFKDEILASPGSAGLLFSSTDDKPVIIDSSKNVAVSLVPLLCSDNIELGLPHGSTFLVSEMVWTGLQPMAAGYVLYGSATIFTITVGSSVVEFTLDQDFTFRMTNSELKVPDLGDYFSVDAVHDTVWLSTRITKYIRNRTSEAGHKSSYDCIVSDMHRIIKKGGLFMSPKSEKFPKGRFSVQYQLAPFAFLLEKAGGLASNGSVPILDLKASSHEVTSQVFMGSLGEVNNVQRLISDNNLEKLSLTYFPVSETKNPRRK